MQNIHSHPLVSAVRKTLSELGILPGSKILVGVSGGIDSMVLIHVFKMLDYSVAVAHVNFRLRGNESDEDAMLVRQWCHDNDIAYFEHYIDTKGYARDRKLNTQSAAREIRYQWWHDLMMAESFDFVATAHHRDDAIETFFINLFRGTGIKGLKGIPAKRDVFIRPMLRVSRIEIEDFASLYNVPFRIDRSNETDDYHRNRIRHHFIPMLNEFMNDPGHVMHQTLHRIRIEWEGWQYSYVAWQSQNVIEKEDTYYLKTTEGENAFLLRWLEEKDIPWQLAYDYVTAGFPEKGKILQYGNYQLSRTKDGFYLESTSSFQTIIIEKPGVYKIGEDEFSIEVGSKDKFISDQDPYTEYIDRDALQWPLQLRQVHQGDYFQPLGMNGQSKKLQDFLIDLKLDHFEKKQIKILAQGEDIIWIVGKRLDERFRITPETKEALVLAYRKMENK